MQYVTDEKWMRAKPYRFYPIPTLTVIATKDGSMNAVPKILNGPNLI